MIQDGLQSVVIIFHALLRDLELIKAHGGTKLFRFVQLRSKHCFKRFIRWHILYAFQGHFPVIKELPWVVTWHSELYTRQVAELE